MDEKTDYQIPRDHFPLAAMILLEHRMGDTCTYTAETLPLFQRRLVKKLDTGPMEDTSTLLRCYVSLVQSHQQQRCYMSIGRTVLA
jgi:hypothetical protein